MKVLDYYVLICNKANLKGVVIFLEFLASLLNLLRIFHRLTSNLYLAFLALKNNQFFRPYDILSKIKDLKETILSCLE